jgi:putative NIF3 family GTP cyclohydrolase 1 type 2
MKQIKFLLAIALVSVFAISCKETPKEEAVEVAVDSTAAVVEEVIEEVKE